MARFREIYKENFDVLQLSKMGNVIVEGKPGKMFVYLVSSSMIHVPIRIEKADFHEKLISVLAMHKRGVLIET